MEGISEEQRLREEAEIRERDRKRQQEKEEYERRLTEERAEEDRKRREAQQLRLEEEKRKKRQEEEWKRLGPDVIQDLPPVPPPVSEEGALEMWYLDDETSQPPLSTASLKPGRKVSAPAVTMKALRELGVVLFRISMSDFSVVKQIIKEREYKHTDEVKISQTAKDDSFLERWYQEHYTEDEQFRVVMDGSFYLDIRSKQDEWIRVHLKAGDLVVLPAGMYHRATLDEDDYVALYRGFQDAPCFVPVKRSDSRADSNRVRLAYLMSLKKGDVATQNGFLP
ncbi:1,2-Dihydroxy-3-keto-5-methylthiopentene dioxygenase, putative [Leishmania panamensis]|uniref:1,2-Dihydroxy-3-keto-5-methylthiopentene dioxygenase, putative n=1 Tax=Leishmania panamensis TaxID=5679 RepID=A0A088RPL9_LEIPA|nr:1,2-Dihydroxy-3-keto-5-methylthiopentene dioxygenase, putative [Leishmania panamensis]AIN97913.1 1,2-Dihydroxy-3-keto-5-methylthiopentene dioxygenase, putative [Leishmania panamensis]